MISIAPTHHASTHLRKHACPHIEAPLLGHDDAAVRGGRGREGVVREGGCEGEGGGGRERG